MAIYGNMVVPSKPGGGLPTSNAGGEIYAPGQGVSGRLSDAGIQLAAQAGQIQGQAEKQAGESWGNLGKGLQKLGGFGMIMASREARLDMAKAQEAVSRLQIEGIEERTRLSRLHGAGAVGADGKSLDVEEQWRNWYTQAKARHGEGLGEYGKRYFDLHADTYNVQQQAWAAQYAEQQLGRFQDQQLAFAVDAEASVIGQDPTNAQVVSGSLGRIFALIDQKGQRMGWTPDMAQQAKQAAAGQAMGNAMLQQMQLGRPDVAQALFGQYGHLLSQAQYVQVFQAYQQALLAQGKIDMQSNNWRALGQLSGQSSRPLDMHIEAATSRKAGTPYAYGTMRDCSGHTCEMWQQAPIDPAVRERIFGKPGAHITSDEIIARAAKETGHMFRGAEISPQTVGGGWVIGVSTGAAGREEGISHIVTTFVNSQGVLMVSESSRQGIHAEPFAKWYDRYKPEQLRGANLTSLMAGGAPHPTQGAPAGSPAGGRLAQVPTYTGVARIMAYHESGKEGSMHVSYGLPEKDGVDVGKYSFITGNAGGGPGGSVARFIKWMGTNGGDLGRQLYSGFNQLVGGNWAALNNADLWKSKGAALWKSIVQQNPAEFERLEDTFALKGINAKIKTLSPDLQQAIENDQTGALREMAISTINQYGSGATILQRQWDAHKHEGLESFVKNVYIDKSDPKYFAAFKDKNIGARRAKAEVEDVLGLLRGGIPAQQGQAPQPGMPAQGGMPMMQGGPGMGRGLYASPETVAALGQMQGTARARSMGQWYNAEIEAGRMTYGEAMQQAQLIQDDKLRAGVKTELSQNETIRQTLEKEAVGKAVSEAGAAIEAIQKQYDSGDEAGAVKKLWDFVKTAQTEAVASPRDKGAQAKYKALKEAYSAMSGGAALATDPEAFNSLSQGIADGEITTEEQLVKNPAYMRMASKDKNGLKTLMKNLQKVDVKELQSAFNEIIGSPLEEGIEKDEKQRRNAMWKQIQLDVAHTAKETNLGTNAEWLRKQVERYASGTVTPRASWLPDGEKGTVGRERTGEKRGDYLPEASQQELDKASTALATLFDSDDKTAGTTYMAEARKWKERHSATADEKQVAKLLWVRSQREADARNGRSPARTKGVPEQAKFVQHKSLGWGWTWREGASRKFEPYIYTASREG